MSSPLRAGERSGPSYVVFCGAAQEDAWEERIAGGTEGRREVGWEGGRKVIEMKDTHALFKSAE